MRLVYYVIIAGGDGRSERQWLQSVRSLRRYNRHIPIFTFVFNGLSDELRAEARHRSVTLCDLGNYRLHLCSTYLYGDLHGYVLSKYPTLAKFFVLPRDIREGEAERLIYLDCDTFFFDDVELLFDAYRGCEWYSREEPLSRSSPWGYDPRHIDEDRLAELVTSEGGRWVEPFNSGVCLMTHRAAEQLDALRDKFLDLVWRLLVDLAENAQTSIEPDVRAGVRALTTEYDRARALKYPSQNAWIVEQIALWLTLGQLPGLSFGPLTRQHALQSTEFAEAFGEGRHFVLCHYFSVGEAAFFEAVDRL